MIRVTITVQADRAGDIEVTETQHSSTLRSDETQAIANLLGDAVRKICKAYDLEVKE